MNVEPFYSELKHPRDPHALRDALKLYVAWRGRRPSERLTDEEVARLQWQAEDLGDVWWDLTGSPWDLIVTATRRDVLDLWDPVLDLFDQTHDYAVKAWLSVFVDWADRLIDCDEVDDLIPELWPQGSEGRRKLEAFLYS